MATSNDFKDGYPDVWTSQAVSNLCSAVISLGSKQTKYQSTSGFLTHLHTRRPTKLAEVEKKEHSIHSDKSSSKKQASLSDISVWRTKW